VHDAACVLGQPEGPLERRHFTVDRGIGCLRLLALVDLLARVRWADSLCVLQRDGAELHPSLLRAAATAPLTAEARFDETAFRSQLARFSFGMALEGAAIPRLTGATR
jgi:hypothetical protein